MNEGQCCCPDSTTVPTRLMGCLLELDIRVSVECLQKVALFGTVKILRKLLEVDLSCYCYGYRVSLPNQYVSYSYNLQFKSVPVVIPRSGTQRHANSFKIRATRLQNS